MRGRDVRRVLTSSQSVGHIPAADRILEATYRALTQLPASHLPAGFAAPALAHFAPDVRSRVASPAPTASGFNTPRAHNPPLTESLFAHCWIALAGMTTPSDATAFIPFVASALYTQPERISMTNDVNLLAAPALHLKGIDYVVAVVCGTGTVGRTIKIDSGAELPPSPPAENGDGEAKQLRQGLPLQDVGVSRGWGYMLDDEGSAFWLGRAAVRELLHQWDREHSNGIYSVPAPAPLPLHEDLMEYFAVDDPTDLIGIVALMGDFTEGLSTGEASAKRNAYLAGAARVVFKWAFPSADVAFTTEAEQKSHEHALKLAQQSIVPLVDLTAEALGDRTVVDPTRTALNLGGGLMNADGYRQLLLDGLKARGVVFRDVVLVGDAAGEGAKALAAVTFGH